MNRKARVKIQRLLLILVEFPDLSVQLDDELIFPSVELDLLPCRCRLLVLRLRSSLPPGDLSSLAEELEESVHSHAVTLVLQRRPEEPDAILVAALPSRDLSWELARLRSQGYSGLPEASSELSMCEGDQLVLRFSGNIAATGDRSHLFRVLS